MRSIENGDLIQRSASQTLVYNLGCANDTLNVWDVDKELQTSR